eukprot:207976_1
MDVFMLKLLFFMTILLHIIDGTEEMEVNVDGTTKIMEDDVYVQPESNTKKEWESVEFHDTGIDEINWHDHLQFYWNTPILSASSDPEIHPFLQQNIFPNLHQILKQLPPTDNRFGDLFNVSDVINLFDDIIMENESNDDGDDENNENNEN